MTANAPKPSEPARVRTRQRAGWAPLPGVAHTGSRRILLAALTLGLCLLAAGVSIATFSSPTSRVHPIAAAGSSASYAGRGGAQPGASAAPGRTARATVTGHGIAGNALRPPRRLKREMFRWTKGSGGAALSAVTAQLGETMQAAGAKLYPVMKQACITLAADARAARAAPPIPDAAMRRLYVKSLTGLDRAAAVCRKAISVRASSGETSDIHVNASLVKRARVEFAALSARLYRATAEIRFLHR